MSYVHTLGTFVMQAALSGIELSEINILFVKNSVVTVADVLDYIDYYDIKLEENPTVAQLLNSIESVVDLDLIDRLDGQLRINSEIRLYGNVLECRLCVVSFLPILKEG